MIDTSIKFECDIMCSICAEMFTCRGVALDIKVIDTLADICERCSWEMYVNSPDFDDSPPDDEWI